MTTFIENILSMALTIIGGWVQQSV